MNKNDRREPGSLSGAVSVVTVGLVWAWGIAFSLHFLNPAWWWFPAFLTSIVVAVVTAGMLALGLATWLDDWKD